MSNVNIPDVLRSKKFLTALFGSILSILVVFIPELEPYVQSLHEMFLALFGGSILFYGLQDGAQTWKTGTTKYDKVAQ